jgi:hypothetical protein
MKKSTQKPAAIVLRVGSQPNGGAASGHLLLRPSEDGWSLITPGGALVFRGMGIAGRRECLEFARDQGVALVLS